MKRVAITGTAPSIDECPWDDKDLTIWIPSSSLVNQNATPKRMDAIFEIHKTTQWDRIPERSWAMIRDRINETGKPCYMQGKADDVPKSKEYPLGEVVQTLGSEYFTSSIAYMLGLAIHLGYERIELYGVRMADDTEYAYQRPCCEHWIGFARGRGIEVIIPSRSDLLTGTLYGYQDPPAEIAELERRCAAGATALEEIQHRCKLHGMTIKHLEGKLAGLGQGETQEQVEEQLGHHKEELKERMQSEWFIRGSVKAHEESIALLRKRS